jgi:hypothetical protein
MLANAEPNNDNPDYDTEQKEVANRKEEIAIELK